MAVTKSLSVSKQKQKAKRNSISTHKSFGTVLPVELIKEITRISKVTGVRKQVMVEDAMSNYLREAEYLYNKRRSNVQY